MSVYATILEGEYNAELKWPFVGEVTVTQCELRHEPLHNEDIPFTLTTMHVLVTIWATLPSSPILR